MYIIHNTGYWTLNIGVEIKAKPAFPTSFTGGYFQGNFLPFEKIKFVT